MRRVQTIVILGLSALLAASCGRSPDTPPTKTTFNRVTAAQALASHEQMLALLADIARRTPTENRWIGDQQARDALDALAALPAGADLQTRVEARVRLAREEGRLGNEQKAIEQWKAVYDVVKYLPRQFGSNRINEVTFRLGLAHLRLGETENCCARNTPESCLLPIRGEGIHTNRRGSEEAIKYFREVLERTAGDHLRARWLLNIAYMTIGGYPDDVPAEYRIPSSAFESSEAFPKFENISAQLGVDTFNQFGGVVIDDFDDDGYLDILTSTWDPTGPMHLFRNMQDGTFSDCTEAAGLTGLFGGINLVQADYDNDGDRDVYVIRGAWLGEFGQHPNSLLRNNGDGTFTDVTFAAGLGESHHPTLSAAWADYDNDGHVDLYVGNEQLATDGFASPGQLFRNNGDGTFIDMACMAGVENHRFTKGVAWGDYDGDRFPDLYVSNLGDSNHLYHNNGDGTFTDVAETTRTAEPLNSFPAWFWDYDNDGILDLYVPSYYGMSPGVEFVAAGYIGVESNTEPSRLYRGAGEGRFVEVAGQCRIERTALPMGANFGDVDGDGFLDFYLGTGYPDYEALMPNIMYRNAAGKQFVDVTMPGGFGHLQKGHGIAFADLDHDGDQDVFAQLGGAFRGDQFHDALFRNPGFGNRWLTLELVGVRTNRGAIGARIRIDIREADQLRTIYKHVNSGGSFGSSPLRQTIGLGHADEIRRVEIYWPTSDHTQVLDAVDLDQIIRVTEFNEVYTNLSLPGFRLGGKPEGSE